jgi:hypothetical protein
MNKSSFHNIYSLYSASFHESSISSILNSIYHLRFTVFSANCYDFNSSCSTYWMPWNHPLPLWLYLVSLYNLQHLHPYLLLLHSSASTCTHSSVRHGYDFFKLTAVQSTAMSFLHLQQCKVLLWRHAPMAFPFISSIPSTWPLSLHQTHNYSISLLVCPTYLHEPPCVH